MCERLPALTVDGMFHLHSHLTPIALIVAVAAVNAAPAAAKQRPAKKASLQVLADPAFGRMSGAQQLAAISQASGGGHLAVIGNASYVRYPDGTLGGV